MADRRVFVRIVEVLRSVLTIGKRACVSSVVDHRSAIMVSRRVCVR